MATVTPGKIFVTDEKVTLAKLNQLAVPTVAIDDGEVTSAKLSTSVNSLITYGGAKNAIINPMFDISTRSQAGPDGPTAPEGGGGTGHSYCVDRWIMANSALWSRVLFPIGQTEVPDFPKYMLHWSATIPVVADPSYLSQRIPDVRTFAGNTVTWAIYVRATTAITVKMQLVQYFGSGGSTAVETTAQSYALIANAWTKLTYTVALPSISGKTVTSGEVSNYTSPSSLEARCIMPQGVAFEVDFAHAQLQFGDNADAFELRSVVAELSLCNLFFERTQCVFSKDLTNSYPCFYFNTPKRNIPALTVQSISAGTGATILPLSINGFYQNTANSDIGIGSVVADSELNPVGLP